MSALKARCEVPTATWRVNGQAAINEKIQWALQQAGLSHIEWNVLETIHVYPVTTHDRDEVRRIQYWLDWDGDAPELSAIGSALERLRQQELIQTLNTPQASAIQEEVTATQPADVPIVMPSGNMLVVTPHGASLLVRMWHLAYGRDAEEFSTLHTARVSPRIQRFTVLASVPWLCQRTLNDHLKHRSRVQCQGPGRGQYLCRLLSVSGPQEAGLFRDYWWREPQTNWRMTGTYSTSFGQLPQDSG